jgi:hypothetical protein
MKVIDPAVKPALFVLFFAICCFLSFNRHSKSKIFDNSSQIWGDKAGYYIYLPALFIYHFQAANLPEHIETNTGNGFSTDREKNKITTKYTYGVALMQAPFFIVAHLLAKLLGYPADGFSMIYNKMILIASVFYSSMGLLFLYLFLSRTVPVKTALATLGVLFFGTNIFYYSIFDNGMSHIYSFFLFSVFLFISESIFKPNQRSYLPAVFGLITGLIIMVRPVNVIFLPVFFAFNRPDLKNVLKPLAIIIFFALMVILPQLIYWNYLTNHFLVYSYNNESFTN